MIRILVALACLIFSVPASAQETEAETRSLFTNFIQNQLSTPNRQIQISGIQGALSSNARIGSITVADREGVWLRITNASIDWSRSALLLRQRLEISSLRAERIDVIRQPVPEEGMPAPESSGFAVPELPVAVNLESLEIPVATFGPTVFGLESELSLTGRLRLEDGAIDTALDVTRLDGPGGQLGLSFVYSNTTEVVDLDLSLSEPENGIVANVLNIEGRPPVALALSGNGELDNLDVQLALDADSERILTGIAMLREGRGGRGFSTRLSGPIAQLIPAQFRDFFGAETSLEAQGFIRDEGGFRLDALDLESAALTLSASAETTADSFLRRLAIDASVEDPSGDVVVLPVPGGDTTVQRAALTLSYGEGADDDWSGSLDIRGLDTAGFAAETMELDLSGLAQNLDQPNDRRITFDLSGAIDGVTSPDEEIAQALGTRIDLTSSGEWASSQPLVLSDTQIEAEALILRLAGTVAEYVFDGDIGVETSSLAPFSGLAGRDLSGALALDARGSVAPISGGFNLTLDGTIDELRIDQEAADNLMGGRTTIAGRIERGANGLVTENLRVENEQFDLLADGTYATGAADFDFRFGLTDLALVSPQASGALTAEGRAAGSDGLINLTTSVTVPSGRLADKQLRDAAIAFEGTLEESDLEGTLAGSAFLDGVRVDLSSAIALVEEERRLTDLVFTAGGARLTGSVVQDSAGLLNGSLDIDAADISTLAALALQEASGAVQASIGLEPVENEQRATLEGTIDDFALGETRIEAAEIQAAIDDLFGVPRIDGSVDASGISAGGVEVTTLQANANRQGETTDFSANARLDNGTTAAAEGSLTPEGEGFRLALTRIDLAQGNLAARLRQPASLSVIGETITIDALALDVGGGSIDATGRIAEQIDLDVTIAALPLSIANTVRPDLELGGTIDGTARVTGPRSQPDVAFDIRGNALQAAALRDAGLSSLGVTARGTTSGERLNIDARATSPEGLDATVRGSAPLLGDGQLALDVTLAAFPLGILNTVVPDQNLGGNLSGTARATGTTSDPQAAFNLSASGLSAAPLNDAGIGALNATAAGNFANQTVTLSSVNVSGNQGLSLSASGTVPLEGAGLAVNLSGEAPLSLANRFLIDRGTQLVGTVGLQGQVTGSISDPQIRGTVSTQGAQIVDPETNISLRGINVSASIDGQTITIQSANATLGAGGTITAGGTVSLAEGLPANISIALNQARYNDGDLIAATVSGNLAFTGPLAADARLSGTVNIERAEISVPENLGGGAAGIDVIHRNPPPGVAATLQRARANDGTPVPTSRPSVIQLDVTVNAPNQIFVRGRGLDAELGGSVRVLGPVTNVQPVGAFELIRGRLGILGQRIEFEEGTITLVGDLDPVLNFVASSESDGTTVFITVSGRVSDLDISFSSSPQLPEDEVLARLIFNRSLNELSAFQIAQLAAAAAELAGGGNSSLLGSLRSATGLDDLDIVTDSEGNAAVRAGRYIQDNIYLGVEAGAGGTARGTINLDITDELKARGAVGSDGDSSLGVFFERDY